MTSDPHLLAAIDLGSNSFRLEIARIQGGRYRRVDEVKASVRLGSGLDAQGLLSDSAIHRGLDTLRLFAQRLAEHEVGTVRAVATQTLREARNRNAFLALGEQALGHPIEVISGREEARLIFAGAAHLHPSRQPRLVIDIGGRSTELVLGTGMKAELAESFGLGSQSITQRYFPEGRLSAEAFRQAQVAAGAEFEEAEKHFTPDRWTEALASSGTSGAISQLLQQQGITDGRITAPALAWCIERCLEAGHIDRLQLDGLRDDRKPVLPGGLCILYTIMVLFRIPELLPSKAALRQGVAFELHHRQHPSAAASAGDPRDATVRDLQQRFEVDMAQARRVKALATEFQRQGLGSWPLEDHRELAWACDLHEVGMMVSHHDHHRHSAYLVSHADAPGFSQSQQRRVADLILGQRGGLKKVEAALQRPHFAQALLCLRLAVICAHARHRSHAPTLRLKRHKDGSLGLGWHPEGHPEQRSPQCLRTEHLLREEVNAWARVPGFGLHWQA